MARLSYQRRKKLPEKDFAIPSKREGGKGGFPIQDRSHASNALARVSQFGTPEEKAEVRRKVHAKYPGIKISGGKEESHKKSDHKRKRHEPKRESRKRL